MANQIIDWVRIEAIRSSADEAAALEDRLRDQPDCAESRVRLIGYYASGTFELRPRMTPHVLWMIEHHPLVDLESYSYIYAALDPAGFAAIRACWLRVLDGCRDARRFARAAVFLRADAAELAHQLIDRAVELEPEAWYWRALRADSFDARARTDHDPADALAAFADRDAALQRVTTTGERYECLIELASAARAIGNWERARSAATAVLVLASDAEVVGRYMHGIGIHTAHIVLGHVALHAGDVPLAVDHLRTAGSWPKAPPFQPDTTLGEALFARGEVDAVAAYIDACERFVGSTVTNGRQQLIDAGENPMAITSLQLQLRLRSTTG